MDHLQSRDGISQDDYRDTPSSSNEDSLTSGPDTTAPTVLTSRTRPNSVNSLVLSSVPSKRPAEEFSFGRDRATTPTSPGKKQKRMDDGRYLTQIAGLLSQKAVDIRMHVGTNTRCTLHMDWIAGNPDDPDKAKEMAPDKVHSTNGNSVEMKVHEKIAEVLALQLAGATEKPTDEWSKATFFGDWLANYDTHSAGSAAEKTYCIEIQLKRVPGSDPNLLRRCGVHPTFVWAGMNIDPKITNGSLAAMPKCAKVENLHREEKGFLPHSKAQANLSPSGAEGDMRMNVDGPEREHTAKAQEVEGNADNDGEDSDARSTAATGYTTDEETEPGSQAGSSACRNPFERAVMRDEIVSDQQNDVPPQRIRESFVYLVRVLAIRGVANCNQFHGPATGDRNATLLGEAGWVAPPRAERVALLEQSRQDAKHNDENPPSYMGPPKVQVNRARPFVWDQDTMGSLVTEPGLHDRQFHGEHLAPLWNQISDPSLEDVYWLVWQMMCGRKFAGFRAGVGFGITEAAQPEQVADEAANPFSSPSPESLCHDYDFHG